MTLRLQAEESCLSVLGCDMEMWAERRVLANVAEPGSACVSKSLLSDLVAKLPDGDITLESDGAHITVRQGASDWRLQALPAIDFPAPPAVEPQSKLSLTLGELKDAVASVAYAVADDGSRQVLTGVYLHYDGSRLTMVATDTHRLSVRRIDREGLGSSINVTAPEKALRTLKHFPLLDDETLTLEFDDTRLSIDAGNARVVSQLLSGQFPNWERVVPAEHTRSWKLDKEELIDNLSRAMILAKDNMNRVRFSGQGDRVLIHARSDEKGEAREVVQAISSDGDIEIAFNGRYVLDALNAFPGDAIVAELTEASRPAVFRPLEEGQDQFCVVMPMALA
jgi:DNA polymerase-3 subunit beta